MQVVYIEMTAVFLDCELCGRNIRIPVNPDVDVPAATGAWWGSHYRPRCVAVEVVANGQRIIRPVSRT